MKKMIKGRCFKYLLCASMVIAVSGCALKKPAMPTTSGFLSDYSGMKMDDKIKGMYVYRNPDQSLEKYSKFLISPVQIYMHPEAKGKKVDPEELEKLTDFFEHELRSALEQDYEVVNQPGEDVLLVRVAITDVKPSMVLLNVHVSSAILLGPGVGGASFEAELLNSVTNEKVWSVMDSRKGEKIKFYKGLSRWGHTRGVIKLWINFLIDRLDRIHEEEGME